jgi:hypothetical protein
MTEQPSPPRPLRVAIDYDKTYSADPIVFAKLVDLFRDAGHDVRLVTARDERYDCTKVLFDLERVMPVIWTRGTAKNWWCLHFAKWVPDIVIDDKPGAWLNNSSTSPEDLAEWRANRGEGVNYGRATA